MTQEERKSRQWLFIAGIAVAIGGAVYLAYQNRNSNNNQPEDEPEPEPQSPQTVNPTIIEPEPEPKPTPEEIEQKRQDEARRNRIEQYRKRKTQVDGYKNFNYKNGILQVDVLKATNLDPHDKDGQNDPWCKLKCGGTTQKTKVIKNTNNPVWNQTVTFNINDACKDNLLIEIYDKDILTSDHIGKVELRVINVIRYGGQNGILEQGFHVIGSKQNAQLFLRITYKENTKS